MKRKINFKPTIKQGKALSYLNDKETEEILFGGGAGGGKSLLGCFWLVLNCLRYPGTRWLMGRAELKRLKQSTLKTLFEILGSGNKGIFNFKKDVDYKYNAIEGSITFPNFKNSEIIMQDMKQQPSDPEFDTLGSTEYTGAFLDEISEIPIKAIQILKTRLRFKIDEYDLIGKVLYCTNPCKHWAYYDFYKLSIENKLSKHKVFIPALAKDNPHIPVSYVESLKRADKQTKERLLLGNWEYDDDPSKLFDYDSILDMFTNSAERGNKYLSVDVAGRGQDKTVLVFWDGLFIEDIEIMENISSKELNDILIENKIPRSKCVIDEDGVGFGLVKDLPGVKGFVNNSSPIKRRKEREKDRVIRNYKNLKAQCWFTLAHFVNAGKIGIYKDIKSETKKLLIEDLEQIKQKDADKDTPLRIETKEEIKERLGRSTDIGDCLVGETKILTTKGYKFIKDVKRDEQVITPYGNRSVLEIKKKKTKELMKIKFNNGKEIYCTPNHKIYLNDSFKKVKTLILREYKGELFNIKNLIKWRIKRLFTKEKNIGFYPVEDIITKKEMEKSKLCTEEFMRIQQEDNLLKEKKYTILTETISTILQRILKLLKKENIRDFIPCKDLKMSKRNVFSAIKNLLIGVFNNQENIVQTNVSKNISINRRNILKEEIVYSAEKNLKLKNKTQPNAVQEVVRLKLCGEIEVYDLKVQKDHCYYANDILVSNSIMMRIYYEVRIPVVTV